MVDVRQSARSGGKITLTPREPYDSVINGHEDQIRNARSTDLAALQALEMASGELAYPYFVLRQLFDVHGRCWVVADHREGLLGYALAALDQETGWLLSLVVAPPYRRRGYGRSLTRSAIDILRSVGASHVYLTVKPTNTIAIKLYESIGFAAQSLRENYLGPGEHRIVMESTI
jgi:ribosomal-protein-alanine N-acetyltransferase